MEPATKDKQEIGGGRIDANLQTNQRQLYVNLQCCTHAELKLISRNSCAQQYIFLYTIFASLLSWIAARLKFNKKKKPLKIWTVWKPRSTKDAKHPGMFRSDPFLFINARFAHWPGTGWGQTRPVSGRVRTRRPFEKRSLNPFQSGHDSGSPS